jgi:phospholipid/cholesterol/gamma-HCH transport system permease protein
MAQAPFSWALQDETLVLTLTGRLDAYQMGALWQPVCDEVRRHQPSELRVEAQAVTYCDTAGVALFLALERLQHSRTAGFTLSGLRPEFAQLVPLFAQMPAPDPAPSRWRIRHLPEEVGRAAVSLSQEIYELISFTGELTVAVGAGLRRPGRVRWLDVLRVMELAGVQALFIVMLVGFLMGLIMAFQSAVAMRQFGAEIFVADLVGLSMLRELGPLMTAVLLAGRTGSAFAAELGTMRVREEIDALETMGLEPVSFLVLPRVIGAVLVTPLLTVFSGLAGVIGGALVLWGMGIPPVTYFNEMLTNVTYVDMLGGLFKALIFGVLVAAIGCQSGLQAGRGPSAVGAATTSAVVSGIILIALVDGVFAVIYYVLDI